MSYNNQFLNIMEQIAKETKQKGFSGTREWMESAKKTGKISSRIYDNVKDCIDLRNKLAHGFANDINISLERYNMALNILNIVTGANITAIKKQPRIDPDGYCAYIKEFNMRGENGQNYYFRFSIVYERNYINMGEDGDRYDTGYFIHVHDAPMLQDALSNRHKFHIVSGNNDNHICWKFNITSFEEANAVMFVWVKRYVEILNREYKGEYVFSDDPDIERKANKKGLIPADTYCNKKPIKIRRTFRKENIVNENEKKHTPQVAEVKEDIEKKISVQENISQKESNSKKVVFIKESVYNQIMSILGTRKPELGGMLGFKEDQLVIDSFIFDEKARVNSVEYNPNADFLNEVLYGEWEKNGINFAGIVHSHPGNFSSPSFPDVKTACKTMESFDMEFLFMPIVTSSYDYKAKFNPYLINRDGSVEKCDIEIFKGQEEAMQIDEKDFNLGDDKLKQLEKSFEEMDKFYEEEVKNKHAETVEVLEDNDIFARIRPVIDISHMSKCTIIGVGCGSARTFYENMARVGVHNFYLIDGDISSMSNVASQNGYLSEVGKPKVEIMKNRLLDINDKISVNPFNFMLNNDITDEWLEENIFNNIDRNKTILCSFTDSFEAQKRTAELAIKYNLPYLATQHYIEGTCSELVYWYPGVSKFTPQFILKDRYSAYANGHKNKATSVGSPIFNSMRINSLSSKIATGMLIYCHNKNSEFCSFLNDKPECNLLFVKQKCLKNTNSILKDFFYDFDLNFFDETAWVNPETI